MTISLVLLAVIMFVVIGWLLRQTLNTQPWLPRTADDAVSGTSIDTPAKTFGLVSFLAVATSLFALFISAYAMRMHMGDWSPVGEPRLLWVNSAFLAFASIVYQWTRNAAGKGKTSRLKPGLTVAGLFTFLFLAGQLVAWRQLNASGHYMASNPASAFFYVLTAVHGLHLLGGLWVWARSMVRVYTGAEADSVRLSIELCAVYWHYLLLVWAVLFGLLLTT
ncbi:MAG: cytochrome c oxidase subunit 3 [Woeseia sp.]